MELGTNERKRPRGFSLARTRLLLPPSSFGCRALSSPSLDLFRSPHKRGASSTLLIQKFLVPEFVEIVRIELQDLFVELFHTVDMVLGAKLLGDTECLFREEL